MTEETKQKQPLRLPTCYYCDLPFDHDFDSVVDENTQRLFVGYQPCEKCKETISKGFLLIGVTEHENFPGQPHVSEYDGKKLYPTQNMIVLSNEMKAILQKNELNIDKITDETNSACMPDEFVKELIKEMNKKLNETE